LHLGQIFLHLGQVFSSIMEVLPDAQQLFHKGVLTVQHFVMPFRATLVSMYSVICMNLDDFTALEVRLRS
jgi:hypothetical protein